MILDSSGFVFHGRPLRKTSVVVSYCRMARHLGTGLVPVIAPIVYISLLFQSVVVTVSVSHDVHSVPSEQNPDRLTEAI